MSSDNIPRILYIIFNIAFSDTEQVVFPVSTDIPLEDLKDENNE